MLMRGIELDVVERRNISARTLDGLMLAIYLDREGEQELQSTVPDVVGRQHNLFHSWGATENTVL